MNSQKPSRSGTQQRKYVKTFRLAPIVDEQAQTEHLLIKYQNISACHRLDIGITT